MKEDNTFQRQCERNLQRSVEQRMRYGFCYVYKPVMDDAPWRSFESTAAYRKWCKENLPDYLGYGEPNELQQLILKAKSPVVFFDQVYDEVKATLQKPL
jgi:hypothetical protein